MTDHISNTNSESVSPLAYRDTQGFEAKKEQVQNLGKHAVNFLGHLQRQNQNLGIPAEKLNRIFDGAKSAITTIQNKMEESLRAKVDEGKGKKPKLHAFKEELEDTQKEVNKVLYEAQTNITEGLSDTYLTSKLHEVYSEGEDVPSLKDHEVENLKKKVSNFARGGTFTKKLYQFLSLVSNTYALALKVFSKVQQEMQKASKADIEQSVNETLLDKDSRTDFETFQKTGNLDKRVNVVGIKGIYRFKVASDKKMLAKQFKAFINQENSQLERNPIQKKIQIDNATYQSEQVPLNSQYDRLLNVPKDNKEGETALLDLKDKNDNSVKVFGEIFGNAGLSSMAREGVSHLANTWMSQLSNEKGDVIVETFRHAIVSARYETEVEARESYANQAAQELAKALALKSISERGISLQEASKNGVNLSLFSVSLVTPDIWRSLVPIGNDERRMQFDQEKALNELSKLENIVIDGIKIPVKINATPFCFGVNSYAGYGGGVREQYGQNVKAFDSLKNVTENILYKAVLVEVPGLEETKKTQKLEEEIRDLMNDIDGLMDTPSAYIKSGNQYQIGAKIILLVNRLNQIREHIIQKSIEMDYKINEEKEGRPLTNKEKQNIKNSVSLEIPDLSALFNCMSGKDRTGIMDAMAKTFAVMAERRNGNVPTNEEMNNSKELQKEFREVFGKMLLESGGLEITELNTGAAGYKVDETVRIWGLTLDVFQQAKGLSVVAKG